jgi:choloylglycine hydrolase
VLTSFATVEEAKAGIKKIKVNRSILGAWNGVVKCHMTLHDLSGKSISVEYLKGELQITDNPTGVYTNDPPFDYHLNNLANYCNLHPVESAPIQVGGASFQPPSSGSGLHGLPGDMLSPSRFIRAFFMRQSAPANLSTAEQVATAFHILNSFDIPLGTVQLSATNHYGGGKGGYEWTEWTVVSDLKNQVFYIRTFDNPDIRAIDMKEVDLGAKDIRFIKLDQKLVITDLSR